MHFEANILQNGIKHLQKLLFHLGTQVKNHCTVY